MTDAGTRTTSWVLAVDFGTSSTAAAIGRDGGAELVGVDGGLPRMLSNVFWQESIGRLLLGDVADHASAQAPWCFERSPKVKLGQQYMLLGDERVRVSEAVGAVIGRVAQEAIRLRGGEPPAVVRLTHPVRWGDEKREALIEAAAAAGLENPELVLEPVAAATHYARERLLLGQHVAVYDLGGGTLDTAVLQRTEGGLEVVGEPRGRDGFGGEEFDHRLYRFLGSQLPEEQWLRLRIEPEENGDTAWPKANRQFQRNVRRAKELLTHNDQVDVDVPSPVNRGLVLHREDLESLIRLDLEDSVRELERTIESAGLSPEQLTAVYLAGGSSQIPLVSRLIEERLGVAAEHLNDAKAVICLGAALGRRALDGQLTASPRRRASGATAIPDVTEVGQPTDGATAIPDATEVGQPTNGANATEVAATPSKEGTTAAGAAAAAAAAGATEIGDATEIGHDSRVAAATDVGSGSRVADATEIARRSEDREAASIGDRRMSGSRPAAAPRTDDVASGFRGGGAPPTGGSPRVPVAAAAEPQRTAARARREPTNRKRTPLLAGGAVAALIVVVGAVALLGGGGSKRKPTPTTPSAKTVSSGPLQMSYGSAWTPTSAKITGLDAVGRALPTGGSATPVALKSGSVTLAAGVLKSSASIPGGAPPQLVSQYGKPASSTNATVAGGKGREYTWAPQSKRVIAYVAATGAADAAVICQAPFHGPSFASCDQLASSAKLSGVSQLAPGPVWSLGSQIDADLAPAVRLRGQLHDLGGTQLAPRAAKAAALASADDQAATAIAKLSAPARYQKPVASLAASLRAEADHLSALAAAARAGHRDGYARAAGAVDAASRGVRGAATPFSSFGLPIQGLGTLTLAGPPAPSVPSGSTSSGSAPTTTRPAPTPTSPAPTQTNPGTTSPPPSTGGGGSSGGTGGSGGGGGGGSGGGSGGGGGGSGGCSGTCTTPFS
ncbi:MAG: Hsp70 family protein [Solirubrobacterales bacterium]|nr:Hsp70 family protein [Solirubrobacterales bacterium]